MGIWFRRKNEKMRMVLREKIKILRKWKEKNCKKIGLRTEENKKTEFRPRERNRKWENLIRETEKKTGITSRRMKERKCKLVLEE